MPSRLLTFCESLIDETLGEFRYARFRSLEGTAEDGRFHAVLSGLNWFFNSITWDLATCIYLPSRSAFNNGCFRLRIKRLAKPNGNVQNLPVFSRRPPAKSAIGAGTGLLFRKTIGFQNKQPATGVRLAGWYSRLTPPLYFRLERKCVVTDESTK